MPTDGRPDDAQLHACGHLLSGRRHDRVRIQRPDGEMTISFRYELQDGGRRLRATEQVRGGGRDQDNLWVFERP